MSLRQKICTFLMVKKAIHLGKDNNQHPFKSNEVVFATQHEKEKILAPLFAELGLTLTVAPVDTDKLGTFSGEIERTGTLRETLKQKLGLAVEIFPEKRFFLASEGSFGPHPVVGFINSNLESLLFFDKIENIEIYVDHLSTDAIADEIEIGPKTDFQDFLKRNYFPNYGLIVRPSDSFDVVFKGLRNEFQLHQSMLNSFMASKNGRIIISTDQRAFQNPSRQRVIYKTGTKLIEALKSICPVCGYPGFVISHGLNGLPCIDCGFPSQLARQVVYTCNKCRHEEIQDRPDGLQYINPDQCGKCNP